MDNLKELDKQAKEILAKYDQKSAAVLPLLHLGQQNAGYVTPEIEEWVSKWTEVPIVHVHEVVTFYTMFRRKPGGKHHIRFCTTTSCVLRGADEKLEYLKKKLNIPKDASGNESVSLEETECLCACEMAPMMQVNDEYHGPLTELQIDKILDQLE